MQTEKGGIGGCDPINMHQRKGFIKTAVAVILILCAALLLFGCEKTLGEEDTPEITLEYLSGSYAAQLKNDGAEVLLGSVELNKGDSGLELILHPKELVQDDTAQSGWRVDSFALNRTFSIPEQAHITFLPEGENGDPKILKPDGFYDAVQKDYKENGSDFASYGDHKLYDVYVLDGQALLILAHPL